jgi:hypothetical protein
MMFRDIGGGSVHAHVTYIFLTKSRRMFLPYQSSIRALIMEPRSESTANRGLQTNLNQGMGQSSFLLPSEEKQSRGEQKSH